MSEQRVKGKGSLERIRPGVVRFRFNMGYDPDKKKYVYSSWRTLHLTKKGKFGQEAEIREAMEKYKRELNNEAVASRQSRISLGQYAIDFHEERQNVLKSPLSYKREGTEIDHIVELLGDIPLADLRAFHIKKAYAKARKSGRFSEAELKKTHVKLNQILRDAVRGDLIVTNPCDKVDPPKPAPYERRSLTQEEASELMDALLEEPMCAQTVATILLLQTGMRRSEAMGCVWKDYDEKTGVLTVDKQYAADLSRRFTKSEAGHRKLHLNEDTQQILAQWRAKQKEELASIKVEQTMGTPIVHALSVKLEPSEEEDGETIRRGTAEFMNPNNYSRWFRDFCADNGFGVYTKNVREFNYKGKRRIRGTGYEGITPHMLRHTQATLLIGAGADMKTVQNRLGHSNVSLTLNTYSHAIPAKDKEAAEVFGSLIKKSES